MSDAIERCSCGGELDLVSDSEGRTVGTCQACGLMYYIDADEPENHVDG
jgi:hypothetical protein